MERALLRPHLCHRDIEARGRVEGRRDQHVRIRRILLRGVEVLGRKLRLFDKVLHGRRLEQALLLPVPVRRRRPRCEPPGRLPRGKLPLLRWVRGLYLPPQCHRQRQGLFPLPEGREAQGRRVGEVEPDPGLPADGVVALFGPSAGFPRALRFRRGDCARIPSRDQRRDAEAVVRAHGHLSAHLRAAPHRTFHGEAGRPRDHLPRRMH
mmetsp:Transcript_26145/g.63017  ORF Transcript_26145/g.63017 Transcript_26145/m.63017 type:complete len:208 (-) Transcript_26145:1312-1935(-)